MPRRVKILRSIKPITSLRRHLQGWKILLGMASDHYKSQREREMHRERVLVMQQKQRKDHLTEAKIANDLVLQDIKIEREKLRLRALELELYNKDPDNYKEGVMNYE